MTTNGNIIDLAAARSARAARRNASAAHSAQRFPIDHVGMPRLARTLKIWHALAGPDGVLRLGRERALTDLADSELFGGRSMLVNMTGPEPDGWLIGYYGRTLVEVTKGHYVSRRFSDLPGSVAAASLSGLREVLPERRIAVHRITGTIWGPTYSYDRLVLPLADGNGPVNRFLTVSQRLADDWAASRLPS